MSVPYNTSLFYYDHLSGTIKVRPDPIKLPFPIKVAAPKRGRPRKIPDMEAPKLSKVIKRRRRRSKDISPPGSIAFRTRMGTSTMEKRASLRLKLKGPIPPPPIDHFAQRTVELTSDIKMGDPACKELFLSTLGLFPKKYLNGELVKPTFLPVPERSSSPRRPPLPTSPPQSSASSSSSTILAPQNARKAFNPSEIEKSFELQTKPKALESSVEPLKNGSTPFTALQRILWETYSEDVVVVEETSSNSGSKEDNFKLNGEKFPFLTSLLADGNNNDFEGGEGGDDDDIIIEKLVLKGKIIMDSSPPKENNTPQPKKSIMKRFRPKVLPEVIIPQVIHPQVKEYRPPTPDSDATTEFEDSEDSGMEV